MKKRIAIIATVVLLMCVLQGCVDNNEERTITIAYNPRAYASAISQIMKNEKLLEEYLPKDVVVEWVEMSNASDIRDALASGEIDIATPALTAYITASENNYPIKLLSNYGHAQVSLYTADGVRKITDLKAGDKIAIKGLNSNPHIALLAYCKELDLDVNAYNDMLIKIPEAETIGMLSEGVEIEGAVLSYPVTKNAEELDNVAELVNFTNIIKEYNLGTVVCANSDYYKKNEDIVCAFEAAHENIVINWDKDISRNAIILSEQYKCSVEEITEIMKQLKPTMEITGYDKLATLMYECDMIAMQPKTYEEIMK